MKKGNWIPLDKNLKKFFPKRRTFSEIEAAFSISLDYDCKNLVTVAGYAWQWGWSRKRVNNFFIKMGIEIIYPKNTALKRNQRGHIGLHKRNINGTYKEHIRLIDSRDIGEQRNINGTYREHKRNIKGSTTIDPKSLILNPEPKDKKLFPPNSDEFRVAMFLYNRIIKNKPDFKWCGQTKPNFQTWALDADYMLRIDKRDLGTVKKIITWCQADSFERTNVLSVAKLRQRFDSLEIKMKNSEKPNNYQKTTGKTLTELAQEMVAENDAKLKSNLEPK